MQVSRGAPSSARNTFSTMNQRCRSPWSSAAWLVLSILALSFVVEALDRHFGTRVRGQGLPAIALLGNTLPPFLMMMTLLCLTRRVALSFVITASLCGIFYTASFLKQHYLGSPLSPADFRMVGQMGAGGWNILSKYLPGSPKSYIAGALALACIAALFQFEPRSWKRGRGWIAVPLGLCLLLSLGALFCGTGPWAKVYRSAGLADREVIYQTAVNAAQNGLITNQIQQQIASKYKIAKGNKKLAQAFFDKTKIPPALHHSDSAAPDVVVIQSEAFFDPRILKGFAGPSTVTEYSDLAKYSTSGNLHVPTIGGATIRTEFEVLTGISLRYFEGIQYPYLQLNMNKIPNLIGAMKSHGYRTTAIHGNDGAFWNRDTIFRLIGVDNFITKRHFARALPNGNYTADSFMTDEIMAQLQHADGPQFIFAISMEAHGPYSLGNTADPQSRDHMSSPSGLSSQERLEFQTYMYHATNADKELGRLASWLAQRGKPYILVFYGDHLPALHPIYQKLGFKDGRSEYAQPVPWILIDSRVQDEKRLDIASWMLPDLILEHAGIPDGAYFALTRAMRAHLSRLTQSPYQRPEPDTEEQKEDDAGMRQVATLRVRGKL